MSVFYVKYFFPNLNFTQLVNHNLTILGRRLYSPSLKDVAESDFSNFLYICVYFFPRTASTYPAKYGKLEKLTERLLAKLNPIFIVRALTFGQYHEF